MAVVDVVEHGEDVNRRVVRGHAAREGVRGSAIPVNRADCRFSDEKSWVVGEQMLQQRIEFCARLHPTSSKGFHGLLIGAVHARVDVEQLASCHVNCNADKVVGAGCGVQVPVRTKHEADLAHVLAGILA